VEPGRRRVSEKQEIRKPGVFFETQRGVLPTNVPSVFLEDGMFWQIASTAFGITAALIIAGGWVFLQYRRDQLHYKVVTLALDRGLQALPGSVPAWIRSLRQGILILLLGVGLLGAGIVFYAAAGWVDEMPANPRVEVPPTPAGAPTTAGASMPPHPAPPPPNLPRWERMERLKLIGLVAMCTGGILILLGIARIAFARIERRYLPEPGATPNIPASEHQ
jgi:hypothetical protein